MEQLSINGVTTTSHRVNDNHFSMNTHFARDDLGDIYDGKIQDLRPGILRYPGGTETETHFDLTNPDLPVETPWGNTAGFGLADFLDYAKQREIDPVIVIPVKRYASDVERGIQEISDFVERVTSEDYTSTKIYMFELGNEFWNDIPSWDSNFDAGAISAVEYGELVSVFSETVKSSSNYDVAVSVEAVGFDRQMSLETAHTIKGNGAEQYIDFISSHFYPRMLENVEGGLDYRLGTIEQWEALFGKELGVFLSEWNVKGTPSLNPEDVDWGLRQATVLLEAITEFAEEQVDIAAFWALQEPSRYTSLSESGETPFYRIGGEMFRILSNTVVDTELLDISYSGAQGDFIFYGFESDSKISLFISYQGSDLSNATEFTLDTAQLPGTFSHAWAQALSVDGGADDPGARPIVTTFNPILERSTNSVEQLKFSVEMLYEVIHVELIKADLGDDDIAYRFVGDVSDFASQDGDDEIFGDSIANEIHTGRGNDRIYAESGEDIVFAGGGADTVFGGAHSDEIFGQADDDQLAGGGGNDRIIGGGGSDIIVGEIGSDYLNGSVGDDWIHGGAQNDILVGGEGADTFVFDARSGSDVIRDFEYQTDVLKFYGISMSELSITTYQDSTQITYGGNKLTLRELVEPNIADSIVFEVGPIESYSFVRPTLMGSVNDDALDGSWRGERILGRNGADTLKGFEGDDRLDGGAGSDVLFSGLGNDSLFGGDGDDRITVEGGSNLIDGGEGEDWLDYSSVDHGIEVDLGLGVATYLNNADRIESIEHVEGGDYDDEIKGDANSNDLFGGDGDDFIFGLAGDDLIIGGSGSDRLSGGSGNDYFVGGSGKDVFVGGPGEDTYDFTNSEGDKRIIGYNIEDQILLSGQSEYSTLTSDNGVYVYYEEGRILLFEYFDETLNIDF